MDRKPGHLTRNVKDAVSSLTWIKLVAIGSVGVGKTCLIKNFCESKFSSGYQPTVGVDYGFKIQNVQGTDLRVHLWDLSGNSEYLDVRNELYNNTDALFLVYDVSSQSSFDNLEFWLKEASSYCRNNPVIVVVGNKTDLKPKRAVSITEGKRWATHNKLGYFETSAATGDGIQKMFNSLLVNVLDRQRLLQQRA